MVCPVFSSVAGRRAKANNLGADVLQFLPNNARTRRVFCYGNRLIRYWC